MCVVAPGKQPKTFTERVLSTSSGYIIHLMPGDHLYDPCSFNIVVVWNGLNHYVPSYLIHHSAILQYRCSVISQLLSSATTLFAEIESDLDDSRDEELIEQFHCLRDTNVLAKHLLTTRGMESGTHFPPSTTGPDPRDTKKHLTRVTPLPKHPKPLIQYPFSDNIDPDSVIKAANPTPAMPLPPTKDLKEEDFNINPADYETNIPRCIKTPGQLAPGRLLPSKQQLLVSIPYPLDPTKGHPPAKPDSIGARCFKKGLVPPPMQAELVDIVKDASSETFPYEKEQRITQKMSVEGAVPVDKTSEEWIVQTLQQQQGKQVLPGTQQENKVLSGDQEGKQVLPDVIDVEEVSGQIVQAEAVVIEDEDEEEVSSQQFSITSETIQQITIEDDDDEDAEKKAQEKIKSLKRKILPSRKSPRVKIPKLDMQKGVTTALSSQQQSMVESLAKAVIKNLKTKKQDSVPVRPVSRQRMGQPSSSSSSQVSGNQRSVLQMYAEAAQWIAHLAQASGSQMELPHHAPQQIMQKPKQPPKQPPPAAPAPPPAPGHRQQAQQSVSHPPPPPALKQLHG